MSRQETIHRILVAIVLITGVRADESRPPAVPGDTIVGLRVGPTALEWFARVTTIGPGRAALWIDAGAAHGVVVGDRFLARYRRQPIARLDVVSVEGQVSFCRVEPLAENPPITIGQRVALWPSPARRERGALRSAVSLLDRGQEQPRAWVAHPGSLANIRPQVQIVREGYIIGLGVIERTDDLFAYVRVLAERTMPSGADGTTPRDSARQPSTQPVAPTGGASWTRVVQALWRGLAVMPWQSAGRPTSMSPIMVGDAVRFRTSADVTAGRVRYRVLDVGTTGAVIDAGLDDGVMADAAGRFLRDGQVIGTGTLRSVKARYSIVEVTDGADVRPFDEFRLLGQRDPAPRRVFGALVADTASGWRISLHRPLSDAMTTQPVLVTRAGRIVGGAWIVRQTATEAVVVPIERTVFEPFQVGDELVFE